MATSKRPALRKNDTVTLSRIKSPIPAYGGKPFIGRETELTVSHITGTGAKRNPWGVVVTDGSHFWHLEPGDVTLAETRVPVCTGCRQPAHASETDDAGYHPGCVPKGHSTKKHLDNWLDQHGYRHASARKQKTPHPYAASSRVGHAKKTKMPLCCSNCGGGLDGSDLRYGLICPVCNVRAAGPFDDASDVPDYKPVTPFRTPNGHARKRLPFSTRKCHACDAEAVGVRDRRSEGGMVEAACARHADPTIPAYPACYVCNGRIRPTSYDVDGTLVHKACHAEDCK